ncbi:enoyl-CoA hydratase/isomerase [mine drainage metagenome]|uniref:Enoyl-CoA hydratase/isomerase n=1 Tax=mine drainage metagenome TaxID=410659 RepID=T1D6S3_9ZZZZ
MGSVGPGLARHVEGSVVTLTFSRPSRLNAFGPGELRQLRLELQRVAQDAGVRAVILTGEGGSFSAGGDVSAMAESLEKGDLPEMFHDLVGEQERCVREIVEMPKPVIAALPGVAAGGGFSLALACDWRIGTPKTVLVTAFTALGGIPDGGLTYFLPHYLGIGGAQELLFGGGRLDAQRARELSLLHEIVPEGELMPRARARAQELARGPVGAYAGIKRLLVSSFANSLETQLALERRAMVEATRGTELPEGIRAFRAKRTPRFEG